MGFRGSRVQIPPSRLELAFFWDPTSILGSILCGKAPVDGRQVLFVCGSCVKRGHLQASPSADVGDRTRTVQGRRRLADRAPSVVGSSTGPVRSLRQTTQGEGISIMS